MHIHMLYFLQNIPHWYLVINLKMWYSTNTSWCQSTTLCTISRVEKTPVIMGTVLWFWFFSLLLQRAETSMSLILKYFLEKNWNHRFFENSNNQTTLTNKPTYNMHISCFVLKGVGCSKWRPYWAHEWGGWKWKQKSVLFSFVFWVGFGFGFGWCLGRVRRRRRRGRRRRVGPVLCNRKGGVGGLWWVSGGGHLWALTSKLS